MAVSELDASPVLTLTDIQRALRGRARRKQQLAQRIMFLRNQGVPTESIREQLGVDQDWFDQAEALTFQAQEAVREAMGDSLFVLDESAKAIDGPIGQIVVRMAEIMDLRVQHAELIMFLRSEGFLSEREIRMRSGMDGQSYKLALRWLKDAGMMIRDDGMI